MKLNTISRRSFLGSIFLLLPIYFIFSKSITTFRIVQLIREIFGDNISNEMLLDTFAKAFISERLGLKQALLLNLLPLISMTAPVTYFFFPTLRWKREDLVALIVSDFVRASDYLAVDATGRILSLELRRYREASCNNLIAVFD